MTDDVAIIGGGTAGAVAALLLARAQCRAVVLERRATAPVVTVGEALPPTARPMLARLGLLEPLRRGTHHAAHANRSAWGSGEVREHDFIRTPYGHGYHLDRAAFDAMLLSMAARAGARVERSARLAGAPRRERDAWRLPVSLNGAQREVTARLVIDATGRNAAFARAVGARRRRHDRLVAFWCVLRGAPRSEDGATLVESFPSGWWYTAELPEGRRVVVLFTDAGTPAARQGSTADGFHVLLSATRHVSRALGGARPSAAPASAAANTSRLIPAHGDGWLAVGDAALGFDPLSSQGIVTAVYTAEKGAATVYHALNGQVDALARYGAMLDSIFAHYLQHRHATYVAERRWPDEPFWRRRAGDSVEGSAAERSAALKPAELAG